MATDGVAVAQRQTGDPMTLSGLRVAQGGSSVLFKPPVAFDHSPAAGSADGASFYAHLPYFRAELVLSQFPTLVLHCNTPSERPC